MRGRRDQGTNAKRTLSACMLEERGTRAFVFTDYRRARFLLDRSQRFYLNEVSLESMNGERARCLRTG